MLYALLHVNQPAYTSVKFPIFIEKKLLDIPKKFDYFETGLAPPFIFIAVRKGFERWMAYTWTHREVGVGDGGSVCEQRVHNGREAGPGGQVQRRGALLVGRVARRLVRQQQLHNVPDKMEEG